MDNFVVLSGCSGGGKSTLLEVLRARGYGVIEEPGRRIVSEQRACAGSAFPWENMQEFARLAVYMSLHDRTLSQNTCSWVFFDRGLIDALVALDYYSQSSSIEQVAAENRYHRKVFLTPPWPEIYVTDGERRHGLSESIEEYERLLACYPKLGYKVIILPKTSVSERADFVLDELDRE